MGTMLIVVVVLVAVILIMACVIVILFLYRRRNSTSGSQTSANDEQKAKNDYTELTNTPPRQYDAIQEAAPTSRRADDYENVTIEAPLQGRIYDTVKPIPRVCPDPNAQTVPKPPVGYVNLPVAQPSS